MNYSDWIELALGIAALAGVLLMRGISRRGVRRWSEEDAGMVRRWGESERRGLGK